MILLDLSAEESAAAMLDVIAESFPNSTQIRVMPTCPGALCATERVPRKKRWAAAMSPRRVDHRIDEVAVPVNGGRDRTISLSP